MKLRELEFKDAPRMLSWMHNDDVIHYLQPVYADKTLDDCMSFIEASRSNSESVHLAVASDNDEYMGTVSLKSIDHQDGSAEFAIVVMPEAMGQGYASFAAHSILDLAFNKYSLKAVYWCVREVNKRAVRFYNKQGFPRTDTIPDSILSRYESTDGLIWYCVTSPQSE